MGGSVIGLAILLGLALGLVARRTLRFKKLRPHVLAEPKEGYRILPWWKAPRSIATPGIAIAIMAALLWPGAAFIAGVFIAVAVSSNVAALIARPRGTLIPAQFKANGHGLATGFLVRDVY
jgi:hypothetical protein